MTRKPLFTAATLAVLGMTALAPHPARAEIKTLAECYTAVINWCTETYPDHADSCGSASGLDDCDDEFGKNSSAYGYDRLRILVERARDEGVPTFRIRFEDPIGPVIPRGDDGRDGGGHGGGADTTKR